MSWHSNDNIPGNVFNVHTDVSIDTKLFYVQNTHVRYKRLLPACYIVCVLGVQYYSVNIISVNRLLPTTIQYYSPNWITRVDVEGRCGYRSPTTHYSSLNQCWFGRLLTFSGDSVDGDDIVWYRSHNSHSSSWKEDGRGESGRLGIRTLEINHASLFNVGKSVDGIGRSGSMSQTSPSPSHNSVDHGGSSGFYSYGDNRGRNRSYTSKFSAYNNGGINIAHPRFPQEDIPRGVHG